MIAAGRAQLPLIPGAGINPSSVSLSDEGTNESSCLSRKDLKFDAENLSNMASLSVGSLQPISQKRQKLVNFVFSLQAY
jgi:hypothetical protein